MIIELDIPDGSPELEELEHVVDNVNAVQARDAAARGLAAPAQITIEEYVVPIVLTHFRKRVQNIYLAHARTKSPTELQKVFGSLKQVRGKKNGN